MMSSRWEEFGSIFGEESDSIFSTDDEIQEDFERSNAFRDLMNDIRNLETTSPPENGYIVLEEDPPWHTEGNYDFNDAFNDDGLVATYQQNRADAYAYAMAACARQEQRGTPPRVNWKKEGF